MSIKEIITFIRKELRQSLLVAFWFMLLTFPIMVIKVNPLEKTIQWRWLNLVYIGVGTFVLSFAWRWLSARRERKGESGDQWQQHLAEKFRGDGRIYWSVIGLGFVAAELFPLMVSGYQVSIMTTALMYVALGLGLNIVVGLAGLLDLGYVAFYAVGAYTYALLNHHFGVSFWLALPLGAMIAACFGLLLGFPVLRLRGDYLAIVTLGFGEIIRLILENWNEFSMGPSGIAGIERPPFFGMQFDINQTTIYIYYIMLALLVFTIFVVSRLRDSRIGRAWIALREDEIACQAMGIDKTKTKLTAFALGATWAGLVGCIFAAKTTFVNPASFTFMESAIILSIVVFGGMGSIVGVMLAAFILILLPEYLRAFAEFRMLVFGGCMVLMMVFRPQGLINRVQKHYRFETQKSEVQS